MKRVCTVCMAGNPLRELNKCFNAWSISYDSCGSCVALSCLSDLNLLVVVETETHFVALLDSHDKM